MNIRQEIMNEKGLKLRCSKFLVRYSIFYRGYSGFWLLTPGFLNLIFSNFIK